VCSGPENPENCPQDCRTPSDASAEVAESACRLPNPQLAVISDELSSFRNFLPGGDFEDVEQEIVALDSAQPGLTPATVERSREAARQGSWGYAIQAAPGQGVGFFVSSYIDKGEPIRFSMWIRSPEGEATLQPLVHWEQSEAATAPPFRFDQVTVGREWTQISFVTQTLEGVQGPTLWGLEVGSNSQLHIDDVMVEMPNWTMAEYATESRQVGGIPVPTEPLATVHFSFLIHIEDPSALQASEEYFQHQTAIFRELARIFHEHGGFLTIQPEQDWAQGAEAGFAPGLLAELARDYGVRYSTHTHGPNCIDPQGVPRSASDCGANRDWDRNTTSDDVVTYVGNLRDLLSQASGLPVTDHNGNFDFAESSRFAEIPMLTWSAYKDKTTQLTYDRLIIHPWRPTQVDAVADVESFLIHDPDTQIVYIPGWGQSITRHHDRLLTKLAPMLSQVIYYANPSRVNTFYGLTHVGHFYSRTGDRNYVSYDSHTGQVTYSDEFLQHLQYYDDMLTELIDPLVEAGYLRWASLPEMGELFVEWEAACEDGGS
jgi:hypothetical protein